MKTALIVGVLAVVGIVAWFLLRSGMEPINPIGVRVPLAPNPNAANGGASTTFLETEKNRLAWAGWTSGTTGVGLMQVGAASASVLLGPGALIGCSVSDNPLCNKLAAGYSTAQQAIVPYIPGGTKVAAVADAGGSLVKTGASKAVGFVKSLF
jgi:hypothetical protein